MFLFNITESAAKRISSISQREEKKLLRIAVNGGGCSGFQYEYVFVEQAEEHDFMIQKMSATILVDQVSQEFLHNATLDYIEELGASYFKITNPNASSKCGCGNSFGV